jgi:cell division protein FtsB
MNRKRKKYQKVDYAPANLLRRLKQESFQQRRSIIKAALAVIIVLAMVKLCVGPFGTIELIRMNQKKQLLQEKVIRLSTELANLEWEARQMKQPFYIEKLAREKYWMLKPGEIIIKLPPDLLRQNGPS